MLWDHAGIGVPFATRRQFVRFFLLTQWEKRVQNYYVIIRFLYLMNDVSDTSTHEKKLKRQGIQMSLLVLFNLYLSGFRISCKPTFVVFVWFLSAQTLPGCRCLHFNRIFIWLLNNANTSNRGSVWTLKLAVGCHLLSPFWICSNDVD